MRIGHGYDVHALVPGDGIILAGVKIPFDKSFLAHSDGDVLIHALCDALLGAAALGDIGQHFPDTDPQYKDIDSRQLLLEVKAMLETQGRTMSNIDITILAESPKLAPHIASMKNNLSSDMELEDSQVNIKATTSEGLGFVGKGEGIAVHAVVLLST